jgi:predicted DNA-binding protein (UPF0251 family)
VEIKSKATLTRQVDSEVTSPHQLLDALKRYLDESGNTEQAVATRMGVNHHTLHRWLSDAQSLKKERLALAACFLRRAGYL